MRSQWEGSCLYAKQRTLTRNQLISTFILDFLSPEVWENKFLFLSHLGIMVFCYGSLIWLIHRASRSNSHTFRTVLFIFLVPKPETAPITINSKTEKLYLYKENKRIQLIHNSVDESYHHNKLKARYKNIYSLIPFI